MTNWINLCLQNWKMASARSRDEHRAFQDAGPDIRLKFTGVVIPQPMDHLGEIWTKLMPLVYWHSFSLKVFATVLVSLESSPSYPIFQAFVSLLYLEWSRKPLHLLVQPLVSVLPASLPAWPQYTVAVIRILTENPAAAAATWKTKFPNHFRLSWVVVSWIQFI